MLPAHQIHTYLQPDPLPPEAVELLGHDWQQAWADTTLGPVRVAIGATADGLWLAGIAMSLESVEQSSVEQPAGQPMRVGSIRQLIVTPGARGQGLAGRLIRRAMTVARENGCTHLRSTAGFGCVDHLLLYERLGFTRADSMHRPHLVIREL